MKHYFHILILIFAFFWNVYLFADVNHVIVYTNGLTDIGLIDSLSADSVYFHDFDIKKHRAEPLKRVYFIYNDFQKLFYKSYSLRGRIELLEQRGGILKTKNDETFPFEKIHFDMKMEKPHVFLSTSNDSILSLNFLEINEVKSDLTMIENSIRKGFLSSTGIFLVGTVVEILMDVNSVASQIGDLLPGGKTYQAMNLAVPLTTMGWMIYDLCKDTRTQFFCPVERDQHFPRNMFIFSFKNWTKNMWENMKRSVFKKPGGTPDQIDDLTPKETKEILSE